MLKKIANANCGIMDFIIQRTTAVILTIYSIFLIAMIFSRNGFNECKKIFTFYIFSVPIGQIISTLAFFSIAVHAWVGVRNIFMDYVKSDIIRMFLHVITLFWNIGTVIYFLKIIWSI